MKKQVLFLAICTLFTCLDVVAQRILRPSSEVTTESHDVGSFTGLDISTDFKAYVTIADEVSVKIESNKNMHEHLKVEVEDNNLVIRQRSNLNVMGREVLIAHITVPSLSYIRGSGDAVIELKNRLTSSELEVRLSGDSKLNGELEVGKMKVSLRGDSYLTVSGRAKEVSARIKGDSHIKSYDFEVSNLELDLSGDSVAKLTVRESMDVDISGDSVMKYKGSPKIARQSVRGDSELRSVD